MDIQKYKVGTIVLIDNKYKGVVVANISISDYSKTHPKEQWSYLQEGLMIDTDFGGLVHYKQSGLLEDNVSIV